MPFGFLKYVQPVHYFRLFRKDGRSVFPVSRNLPEAVLCQLEADTNFQSDLAREYDLSWQAIQRGYTGDAKTYSCLEYLPIVDEYRFVRKYFHPFWVGYVFLMRIVSFKNPFKEAVGFWKSRNQKRVNLHQKPILYPDYETFESELIAENPLVSVIIPTLNRYSYLDDVMCDLENQDYQNFEVIVVDQTEDFREEFYQNRNLKLIYWYQEEKALWKARNDAIKRANGDYILLYDDDSRVDSDWIRQHLKTLDFFTADLSGGVSLSVTGGEIPENYRFFRINDQLDTGNVLLKKEIFREIGLFDRQFEKQRMGDGEFGLRAFLSGYKNISNPYAKRIHLKVSSGGLREMGSWDAFHTQNFFAPRPVPSVLYLYRNYFGKNASILALLKNVPPAVVPYRFKRSKTMKIIGVLLSLLLFPLVVFQVFRSWRLAGKKLEEGAKIENLK